MPRREFPGVEVPSHHWVSVPNGVQVFQSGRTHDAPVIATPTYINAEGYLAVSLPGDGPWKVRLDWDFLEDFARRVAVLASVIDENRQITEGGCAAAARALAAVERGALDV